MIGDVHRTHCFVQSIADALPQDASVLISLGKGLVYFEPGSRQVKQVRRGGENKRVKQVHPPSGSLQIQDHTYSALKNYLHGVRQSS